MKKHFRLISALLAACMSLTMVAGAVDANEFSDAKMEAEVQAIHDYNSILLAFETSTMALNELNIEGMNYPSYYGGSYMNDKGNLVVQLTDDSENVKEAIREMTGNNQIEFEKVEYSYTELAQIVEELDDFLDVNEDLQTVWDNIVSYGILQKNNMVQVEVKDLANVDILTNYFPASESLFYAECSNLNNNSVAEKDNNITPRATSVSLKAGYPIRIEDVGLGSIAYRCKSADGVKGFITLCHNMVFEGDTVTDNRGDTVGTVESTVFSYTQGIDASFVAMNSKTSITNDIYLTSHKLANGEYVANLPEGTTIYSSGRNGTSNGKIISTSASLKIVDYNKTMKKLVKTDASAAAGDSGGLVYYYYGTSEKKLPA